MANKALTMLQVRRILKLFMEESSQREIHRSTGIHRVTIKNYLHRFKSSGKTFSELFELSDYDRRFWFIHRVPTRPLTSGMRISIPSFNAFLKNLARSTPISPSKCYGKSICRIALTGISIPSFAITLSNTCSSMMPPCRNSTSQGIGSRLTLPVIHSGLSNRLPESVSHVPFWSAPCLAAAFFTLNRFHQPGRNI